MFNPFKRTFTENEISYFEFLRKNKLFEQLNKKEMCYFLPHLHLRKYQRNEVVFFRNDPSQALYIIKSGVVGLKLDVKDHFETIMVVDTHAPLGNNALLKNARRIYNAIVDSPTASLYVIPQVNILSIFERYPEVKGKMLESLSEIHYDNFTNLFSTYQSTHGFFELESVFRKSTFGC